MDYFLRFAEREIVRSVITQAMEYSSVQGVVLEIDPTWLNMWRLRETFGQARAEQLIFRYFERLIHGYQATFLLQFPEWNQLNRYWIPSRPINEYDLGWTPPLWDEYQTQFWDSHLQELPIIIKICLYPPNSRQEREVPTFQATNLRIIYETRPPAVLYGSDPRKAFRPVLGGVSIGTGQQVFGTLGGILKCSSGLFYGVTCAHVINRGNSVDQPALHDSSPSASIGTCTHIKTLRSCKSTDPCNIWARGIAVNEVDAALIELDQNVASKLEILQIGKLTGITPKSCLTQGQTIELVGRSSGHKTLEMGGLCVAFRIQDSNGQYYCFHNLIELRVPSFLSNMLSSPVQPGDSGAWVCVPSTQGYEWCGMVVGGDRFVGYAVAGEVIQDWWMSEKKLTLSVI